MAGYAGNQDAMPFPSNKRVRLAQESLTNLASLINLTNPPSLNTNKNTPILAPNPAAFYLQTWSVMKQHQQQQQHLQADPCSAGDTNTNNPSEFDINFDAPFDQPLSYQNQQASTTAAVSAVIAANSLSTLTTSSAGRGMITLSAPPTLIQDPLVNFVKRQSSTDSSYDQTFQIVLMAPTSAAVKLGDEPLTYLNQGQSYEVKFKKLGEFPPYMGRCYKKFQEKELLRQWKKVHQKDKMIDIDVPMSFGLFNVKTDPNSNAVEFNWDPARQVSCFIKLNCISTEFTERKHGGEKGVPFRLVADTLIAAELPESGRKLHSAYSQIKVFKTKGADRKNKTDREKAQKAENKQKFQPGYEYTILTETFPTDIYQFEATAVDLESTSGGDTSEKDAITPGIEIKQEEVGEEEQKETESDDPMLGERNFENGDGYELESPVESHRSRFDSGLEIPPMDVPHVTSNATPKEVTEWLRKHRFHAFVKQLCEFSGADILRLSKDELITLCGLAEGIRLYNALQYKKIQPKLLLYIMRPEDPAYRIIYLNALTLDELLTKICKALDVKSTNVEEVQMQEPQKSIRIVVSEEVVQNLNDKCRFIVEVMSLDGSQEKLRMLLRQQA